MLRCPGGKWHATSAASFAFVAISLEMVFTATSVALQWLSIFAFRIASTPKAFARSESSGRISSGCNEGVDFLLAEAVVLVDVEHATSLSFVATLEEPKLLDSSPETADGLSSESPPHPSGALVGPEDGFSVFGFRDALYINNILKVIRLTIIRRSVAVGLVIILGSEGWESNVMVLIVVSALMIPVVPGSHAPSLRISKKIVLRWLLGLR